MRLSTFPPEPASTRPPFARDSLFAERVRWTGGPKKIEVAPLYRAASWVLGVIAAVSTLLAVAASQAGHMATGKLILLAVWTASFALLIRTVPVLWAQAARFIVTDHHVIWQCRSLKRTIQRDGISFARIRWHRSNPRVGDLDLVRAVPTGALYRKLTLNLQGLTAPHRVWSIVRGAQCVPGSVGGGDVPLEARLDEGEVARWSGRPLRSWKSWLPMTTRRTLTTGLGILCWMVALRSVFRGIPLVGRLLHGGIAPTSLAFTTLTGSMLLMVLLLGVMGGWFLYLGLMRKPLLDAKTRYLVTNQRIILQRGRQELHVDRAAVVDLVVRDALYGGSDVYLVVDGPRARALAAQGAFGPAERVRGFRPVLQALRVQDIDALRDELNTSRG